MKYLLMALMVAGCGGSDNCASSTSCADGSKLHYKLCTASADDCYYQTSDGHTFRCVTCGTCIEAQASVAAWCQTPDADSGQLGDLGGLTCGNPTSCPGGGGSYQACSSGPTSGCTFVTSDGNVFDCNSCTDCAAAAAQAAAWCTPPAPDMGSGCDVVTQSCGTGQKCIGTAATPDTGTCVANGTVGADQPCVSTDTDNFLDNCVAGFVCDNDGPDAAYACRKMCVNDADCSAGQRCSSLIVASWGWCLPTCAPFAASTGCTAGNDCASSFDDIDSSSSSEKGFFVCKKTGSGGLGDSCTQDPDCGSGLWCDVDSSQCEGLCDPPAHMCPAKGGANPVCNPFADQSGAGYCTAM